MLELKEIVSICKRRGFIFQGSEIYGGLANTWDFGPLGVELKRNIKNLFWKKFVITRADMFGLDSSILMSPEVWKASGHLDSFTDPLVDCKQCKERFRADKLIEEQLKIKADGLDDNKLNDLIKSNKIKCPNCGASDFTDVRQFNLMFKTYQGVVEGKKNEIFLRPETAQGIFINFMNILNTMRPKLPFGIAQIGKSFRNEITPGNFIFRTREFEQMEIEYFVKPGEEDKYFQYWVDEFEKFFIETIGLKKENLKIREHSKEELSHYSKKTVDFEFRFSWGFGELMGIASRTDFDLSRHEKYSGQTLKYFDPFENKHYIPYVIEPSLGVERLLLAILFNSFENEKLNNGKNRIVLKINKHLAPIKIAILPLKRNEPAIVEKAKKIFASLSPHFYSMYDDTGSIGKLYRRQDEIGTPFCITVDYQTIEEDDTVTIRDRDSMEQIRLHSNKLYEFFKEKFNSI